MNQQLPPDPAEEPTGGVGSGDGVHAEADAGRDELHDTDRLLFSRLRDELGRVDPAREVRDLALLHAAARTHAHRPALERTWRRRVTGVVGAVAFKVGVVATAAAAATSGLASAGRLPEPIQRTVVAAAASVGVNLPIDRFQHRGELVIAEPSPEPEQTPEPDPTREARPSVPVPDGPTTTPDPGPTRTASPTSEPTSEPSADTQVVEPPTDRVEVELDTLECEPTEPTEPPAPTDEDPVEPVEELEDPVEDGATSEDGATDGEGSPTDETLTDETLEEPVDGTDAPAVEDDVNDGVESEPTPAPTSTPTVTAEPSPDDEPPAEPTCQVSSGGSVLLAVEPENGSTEATEGDQA